MVSVFLRTLLPICFINILTTLIVGSDIPSFWFVFALFIDTRPLVALNMNFQPAYPLCYHIFEFVPI